MSDDVPEAGDGGTAPTNADDRTGGLTRRSLTRGAVGVLTAGAVSYGALTSGSDEARAQVSGLTASDVSIATNDGEINSLTLTPDLEIQWSHFERPVQVLRARFSAKRAIEPPGEYSLMHSLRNELDSLGGKSGRVGWQPSELSLLRNTETPPLREAAFKDSSEGDGPEDTSVDITLDFSFLSGNGSTLLQRTKETSFTVSVKNRESSGSVGGTLNTGGS